MKIKLARKKIGLLVLMLAAALAIPRVAIGQRGGGHGVPGEEDPLAGDPQPGRSPEATAVRDWNQEKDADKKIKLGEQFVQKYPKSKFAEPVYDQLVMAYFAKQDWNSFYTTADKTLTTYPDDSQVLTIVGWVVPRLYSMDDPDADAKLDKAERYEKHALEVIPSMPSPNPKGGAAAAEQFAAFQKSQISLAHSGLGLVYFRKVKYADSVKELQEATQTTQVPNAIDFYALGFGLEQLHRSPEAVDAYTKCSEIPGNLQGPCKEAADKAAAAPVAK